MTGVQPGSQGNVAAWAETVSRDLERRADAAFGGTPAVPARPGTFYAPAPTVGVGRERALLDGVTLDRPFEAVSTVLNNFVERVTGVRDERNGRALSQVLLAGQQLVQAGLRSAAQGTGAVAVGSSVLGKVLPVIGITSGAMQVWKGWNELVSHDGGPLSILGSRTGRTGLLNILAGGLLFVPGIGTALAGAGIRVVAAANELDAFSFLDAPTRRVEEQGAAIAARVHPFDETPTDPYDRTRRAATA